MMSSDDRWPAPEVFDGRTVFVMTGAFLGRIDGERRCAFWADDPSAHDFAADRLIAVDLARTPAAAAAGQIGWREVQVDDAFAGPGGSIAGTTLGPAWPELQVTGVVFLEARLWRGLPDRVRPPCPPVGGEGRPYEFLTAAYWPGTLDPRAGRRYAGHHAEIVETHGRLAHVAVYPPGASLAPGAVPQRLWIDLACPDHCDAGPDALTRIGPGAAPQQGPLFLLAGQLPSSPTD